MDDRRVAEADVHGGDAVDALERPVQRRKPIFLRRTGPRLHVGLVDLDDVGPGGEQVVDLGIDRVRIGERRLGELG